MKYMRENICNEYSVENFEVMYPIGATPRNLAAGDIRFLDREIEMPLIIRRKVVWIVWILPNKPNRISN